ncbi:hypothetical protein AA0481_0268 [Acetobacter orientalis NRIC 0481]|nr:hypothetical protein AA0481_0268 [Acetobacter orientalis NRIC 0481]
MNYKSELQKWKGCAVTGTESSQNVTAALQPENRVAEQDTAHQTVGQTVETQAQAALPDPVVPVTPQPVAAVAVNEQDITMREVAQMVGAMVFVFCFAALGFHAVFYAGY